MTKLNELTTEQAVALKFFVAILRNHNSVQGVLKSEEIVARMSEDCLKAARVFMERTSASAT